MTSTPLALDSSTIRGVSSFLRTPNSVLSSGSYQKIPMHGICSSNEAMSAICAAWSLSDNCVIVVGLLNVTTTCVQKRLRRRQRLALSYCFPLVFHLYTWFCSKRYVPSSRRIGHFILQRYAKKMNLSDNYSTKINEPYKY